MFYFAPGRFQCTAKGIFIPKDLNNGLLRSVNEFTVFTQVYSDSINKEKLLVFPTDQNGYLKYSGQILLL